MHIYRLIPFLLIFSSLYLVSCASLSFEERIKEAELRYQQGKKKEAVAELKEIVQESKEIRWRIAALNALGKFDYPELDDYFIKLSLDDPLRLTTFAILVERETKQSSDKLRQLHLKRVDDHLLDTLGKLKNPSAIHFLQQYSLNESLGPVARSALLNIGGSVVENYFLKLARTRNLSLILRRDSLIALYTLQGSSNKQLLSQDDYLYFLLNLDDREKLIRELKLLLKQSPAKMLAELCKAGIKQEKKRSFWLALYMELSGKNRLQSFQDLDIPLKPVRTKALDRKLPVRVLASPKQLEMRSHQRWQREAGQQGVYWNQSKSRVLNRKLNATLKRFSGNEREDFQRSYRHMARRFPNKDFAEIKRILKDPRYREFILQDIIREIKQKSPTEIYARSYLARYLSISPLEAKILLDSY